MPVELNDLILKRERTIRVPINDDPKDDLVIRWNPTLMTKETYARLQAWQRDETKTDPFEIAEYLIVPLVTGWDITVNGKPHPLNVETVAALGLDLVGHIGRALSADYAVASDTKKDSGAS